MQTSKWADLDASQRRQLLQRPIAAQEQSINDGVAAILEAVRASGDVAIKQLTAMYDRASLDELAVSEDEIVAAHACLDKEQVEAIDIAITNAQPGDVVLLAGKGHETSQIVGDVHIAFDDRRVARELLLARESGELA